MPIAWVHALFRLTPPLQSLIHGLKYEHYRRHARFLCAHLRYRPVFRERMGFPDATVPVPLHSARKRERGYNQSELIAEGLQKQVGLLFLRKALKRVRFTSTQTKLGGEARAKNLRGAFQADITQVQGKKLLLVDDVCTTGSTLEECRQELMRAGATEVGAFVLAWVERQGP